MPLMQELLPSVQDYIDRRCWRNIPYLDNQRFTVTPLAQGEYNLNYLITGKNNGHKLVFRVNIGTQINRSDQIDYEYKTLVLLANSGVTPRPVFVDDTREMFNRGVLIMEFLPGEPLDYRRDLKKAAQLFAITHQVEVPGSSNHLIREDEPLSLIYSECRDLLQHFFDSDLADESICSYLKEVLSWANEKRSEENYYRKDPWQCIVNTEVNSGNFIVNRETGTIHLVDWEMPRWGDPSQDLSHFCSPLTTLWKTTYQMSPKMKRDFIETYCKGIHDSHLRDTLVDRIKLRDPFVYLRGISWSAMGWVAYQTKFAGMKNPDTWQTLQKYIDLSFIRSLFDSFMKA